MAAKYRRISGLGENKEKFTEIEEGVYAETVAVVGVSGGGTGPSGGTVVEPSKGALTDASSTITTGGTAQEAVASNADRVFLQIVCPLHATESIYFSLVGTAAVDAAGSIELQAGDSVIYDGTFVPSDAVSVIAATTGTPFTIWHA